MPRIDGLVRAAAGEPHPRARRASAPGRSRARPGCARRSSAPRRARARTTARLRLRRDRVAFVAPRGERAFRRESARHVRHRGSARPLVGERRNKFDAFAVDAEYASESGDPRGAIRRQPAHLAAADQRTAAGARAAAPARAPAGRAGSDRVAASSMPAILESALDIGPVCLITMACRHPGAVRPGPHAVAARQRRAVDRVPARQGQARSRRRSRPANRDLAARYQRGEAEALEFTEFYLATLVPFAIGELDALHAQFMQERIVPTIPEAARALIDKHRRQGHLLVLDHGDQPLPHGAGGARAGFRAPHRHRARDEGGPLHGPCRGHPQHARGQDRAPARVARGARAQPVRLPARAGSTAIPTTTCRSCRT